MEAKCPPNVNERFCGECREKTAKRCDNCGSTDQVEYRPQERGCFCWPCRKDHARKRGPKKKF